MPIFFKIFGESIILAFKELIANPLRTLLSLLGITIGIFCVIAVLSVIDSFQAGLKQSFSQIGENVLHVDKNSWDFQKMSSSWWKYVKRPNATYEEFEALKEKVKSADAVSVRAFTVDQKLQFKNNNVERVIAVGTTYDFDRIFDVNIDFGRYFLQEEMDNGRDQIILGYVLAEQLFPNVEYGIGKKIKMNGRKLTVIGIIKKEGASILGDGFDEAAIVPYNWFKKYYNVKSPRMEHMLSVRAAEGVPLEQLREEITMVMRAKRHLKPKEENNFEINHLSLLTGMIDGVFAVATGAGFIIGFFAIVVGAIGIANIMFVSVKERTRQIGIKKSLGAKRRYILIEFLIEAVVLTFLGGLLGLLLVFGVLTLLNNFVDSFELFLGLKNVFVGMIILIVIGIIAGLVPAFIAAFMDPVKAIRS